MSHYHTLPPNPSSTCWCGLAMMKPSEKRLH